MCNQFLLLHKLWIESGMTNFKQGKTDGILYSCESHESRSQGSARAWIKNQVLHRTSKWKRHQDTVYWVRVQLAQRKGLKFYQTRSNAIIFYATLPAWCISKSCCDEYEEIIDHKVIVLPRPPPKISYRDNWMCDLDSDVAGRCKDTQRIQPKPNYQSTVRAVCGQKSTKRNREVWSRRHDHVTDSTSPVRPACGSEYTKLCVLTPTHVEEDQSSTVRPALVDQKEEHEIDYGEPGLSHAVVKEAEHLRVQELVTKIENHPHRQALHADLQQNNVYNPFSKNSK